MTFVLPDRLVAAFPRSARYDLRWHYENMMGPSALWLTERLTDVMALEQDETVLDLGCGKALSSVFLAREFGVRVVAADLWIDPTENVERVRRAGLDHLVLPMRAEAHTLPFGEGTFDRIVSVDAFHYFGTDDMYLGEIVRFLRPGGQLAIVVPTVSEEPDEPIPGVPWDWHTIHSAAWWRRHWEKTGLVDIVLAEVVPDGMDLWRDSDELTDRIAATYEAPVVVGHPDLARQERELVEAHSDILGFARVIAARP